MFYKTAPRQCSLDYTEPTKYVRKPAKCERGFDHMRPLCPHLAKGIVDIIGSNLLIKFHEDRKINVASRVLTRNVNARVFKNQMETGGQRTKTNPKTSPEQSAIVQLVREINKPYVLTMFHDDQAKNVTCIVFDHKVSLYHVFLLIGTIYNIFTKFHDDSAKHETNVLTKFHEHWAKNVITCFHYIHIEKNAPHTGGHVVSPIWTIFELV
ncbi:hypothetical protein DPMN_171676 [Dreissena polymorpha]|uniref:Uncharacterized protein n=1 Tax=Dreissena polymorpha TaxID=45954 RepID=A0A9D4ICM4_DREPO|nr:hypothetical protein DPMN_171676 [Dreissena polymorpha]